MKAIKVFGPIFIYKLSETYTALCTCLPRETVNDIRDKIFYSVINKSLNLNTKYIYKYLMLLNSKPVK